MSDAIPSLDTIFSEAIELPDAAKRAGYLARACGPDDALRRRVEALVEAHFRAGGSFLEQPVAADSTAAFAPAADDGDAPGVGTTVGPYTLREQIGEGGMGRVFVAEQMQPVRRKVALKLIKPGMDSRQVVARFEAERQALALMDHPNIAKVLDAGTTAEGRPFFVMELVKGEPITDYCDRNRLNLRQRLELFLQVCQAVQHAHQKGVIHRDLKPSNILIAVHDVTPVAKVIDFGIAKAVGQSLTDKTVYTAVAQFVGTPLYMSPEQAGQSSLDVDTRTDVYALGVLLYELLTGTTPIDPETIRKAGLDEVRRIIREDEPPRPSTRMSTLKAAALSTAADKRAADPRRLARQVRGELDWVVMKCLEKDRNRRYETASSLAADVQRFLADEPVQACPPSAGYRLKKLARRNKAALATTALVALALVAGTAVSAWQAVRADAARRLADERAEDEKAARVDADKQRQRAEANFQKAVEAVDRMLTRVGEDALREVPQMETVRRAVLEDALAFYREFLAERADDARLRQETAVALRRVGNICADLGKPAEARAAFEEALRICLALHAASPDDARYRFGLCTAYCDLGWRVYTTAAEKEETHRKGVEAIEPVVASRPADFRVNGMLVRSVLANALRSRGDALVALGRLDEAGPPLRAAVDLSRGDDGWGLDVHAGCLANYSNLLRRQGRAAEAVAACEQALAVRERVVKANPGGFFRWELAADYFQSGNCLADANRLADADVAYGRASEIADPLATDFPSMVHFRKTAADARFERVRVLRRLGNVEEALRVLHAARPRSAAEFVSRAAAYRELGDAEKALADLDEAARLDPARVETYDRRADVALALRRYDRCVADYDRVEAARPLTSYQHKRRALAHFRLGRLDKALADVTRAVDLAPGDVTNVNWISPDDVAACPDAAFREGMLAQAARAIQLTEGGPEAYAARASLYDAMGDGAKAREDWAAAVAGYKRRLPELAHNAVSGRREAREELSGTHALLGHSLLRERRFAEAEPPLRECLATREEVMPDSWLRFNAMSLLGGALLGQKKYAEAEPLLVKGYEGMKAREVTIPPGSTRLAEAAERIAQLYGATNQPEKAAEWRAKLPLPVAPPPRPKPSP